MRNTKNTDRPPAWWIWWGILLACLGVCAWGVILWTIVQIGMWAGRN